jgi:DNA-binding response OmpR family regulator
MSSDSARPEHRSEESPRRSPHTAELAPSPSWAGPPRIAVIDRDSGLLTVLAKRLERLGWKHQVLIPPVSPAKLASMRLDALSIDLALIGQQRRWEWLERCRCAQQTTAIVVCTAGSTLDERLRGFELGVDDWLAKPCHPEELIARIEAAIRHQRPGRTGQSEPVKVGEVEIRDQHQAFAGGLRLNLTRREFQLLELFAAAQDTVLERRRIYETVWGYPMVSRDDRSVDVFVYKLRQKLEVASPQWQYIHTHWGVGYRFSAEPGEPAQAQLAA